MCCLTSSENCILSWIQWVGKLPLLQNIKQKTLLYNYPGQTLKCLSGNQLRLTNTANLINAIKTWHIKRLSSQQLWSHVWSGCSSNRFCTHLSPMILNFWASTYISNGGEPIAPQPDAPSNYRKQGLTWRIRSRLFRIHRPKCKNSSKTPRIHPLNRQMDANAFIKGIGQLSRVCLHKYVLCTTRLTDHKLCTYVHRSKAYRLTQYDDVVSPCPHYMTPQTSYYNRQYHRNQTSGWLHI